MKHLLNDLSEEVKNSIREQHTGGMKVMTENFSKLLNTKSGTVKLVVTEQQREMTQCLSTLSEDVKPTPCKEETFDVQGCKRELKQLSTSSVEMKEAYDCMNGKTEMSEQSNDGPRYKHRLGHQDRWYDEDDRVSDDFEDYDEEFEFGPDDYDSYTDMVGKFDNRWNPSFRKHYYDKYTETSPLKIRRKSY